MLVEGLLEADVANESDVYCLDQNKSVEELVVFLADTVVDPWAMVIINIDTMITEITVPTARSSQNPTFEAKS